MKIIRMLKIADILTIGNFVFGLLSLFFSIRQEFMISAAMMIAAVIMDALDGRVARLLRQQNEMGKQLDSLSDLTSFGVAPAVMAYCLIGNTGISYIGSTLITAVLVFFAVCGMLRLARFNISTEKDFEGVPITANGIAFPLLYFALEISGRTGTAWAAYSLAAYFLVMGFLMVSGFRIKKL